MPRKSTADSVQQHTEAKLQFYTRYLERYLKILLITPAVDRINLYDLFCGEGQYSDGNTGSAVRAVESVWLAQVSNTTNKPINLHLNDLNKNKIEKLKKILANRSSEEKRFSITYSNIEAADFLGKLSANLTSQQGKARNLVFIDPYGYKDIDSNHIDALLRQGKTEIVLFLPIEQMYRFRVKTIQEEVENSYQPLKKFVDQFNLDVEAIDSEKSFIRALEDALSFDGKYYATSYSIRNHTGHYYGMFFMTSNLLGLEKIIEVKWELDEQQGEGFSGINQLDCFLETERQIALQEDLLEYLSGSGANNLQLYEYVLKRGFRPKHANKILRQLCSENKLYVLEAHTGKPARKNTFKLTYKDYKSKNPAILYRLVQE